MKALARQYGVAPKTIRRVLDAADARDVGDVLEELDGVTDGVEDQEPAPEQPHAIDVPGLLAEHLKATDVAETREALRGGRTIRRGQGYSVRVTAASLLATVWFAGQHHLVEADDWPDILPATVLGAIRQAPAINDDPTMRYLRDTGGPHR